MKCLRKNIGGITFYCHNFGEYDIYYIFGIILNYNNTEGINNPYKFKWLFRDKVMIRIKLSKKVYYYSKPNNNKGKPQKMSKTFSIILCDSYPILTDSVSTLCKNFNINQ